MKIRQVRILFFCVGEIRSPPPPGSATRSNSRPVARGSQPVARDSWRQTDNEHKTITVEINIAASFTAVKIESQIASTKVVRWF